MTEEIKAAIQQAQKARSSGRLPEALSGYGRAVDLAKAEGSSVEVAVALQGMGRVERDLGELESASARYREAAEVCRSFNEPILLAHALRHFADIERERGRHQVAVGPASEAVAIYRRESEASSLELANALRVWALVQEAVGQVSSSARSWQEARSLYDSVGVVAGVKECEAHLRT